MRCYARDEPAPYLMDDGAAWPAAFETAPKALGALLVGMLLLLVLAALLTWGQPGAAPGEKGFMTSSSSPAFPSTPGHATRTPLVVVPPERAAGRGGSL